MTTTDNSRPEDRRKAILVGLDTGDSNDFIHSMEELTELSKALFLEPVETIIQILEHPIAATYIGTGKVSEVAAEAAFHEAAYVIFNGTLSPSQLKNLQNEIDASVMDRTGLILEIFSQRANTREARLQVESARLQYMLPRLVGMRASLSRQGGGSGALSNKGSGEKQIDLDRRHIQKRISELRRELDLIEHDRGIQRKRREKSTLPLVALVGYTNAGKSTVMNGLLNLSDYDSTDLLAEKQVESKDMLFATLDTTVRKISTENHRDFLLSDTVGFIDNLPHTLVKAFRSTLDEIKYADLLLEVVDYSDPHYLDQMQVTRDTLREIGAANIPVIHVMNKCDKTELNDFPKIKEDSIYITALDNDNMTELLALIMDSLYQSNRTIDFMFPYSEGAAVSDLNENARIFSQEYEADGIHISADCPAHLVGKYSAYII